MDIVIKHMNEKIPSICRLRPDLPMEMDLFMQKALAKIPPDRFATPREFIKVLDELSEKIKVTREQGASSDGLDNLIGKSLDSFRIVERVGTGRMGTVFKAYQSSLDRYVAIKILPTQHVQDPVFFKRFVQEARTIARLAHPNIVHIYNFGEQGIIKYIAMEHVDGSTLKQRLDQPLPMGDAIDFIVQAAKGLECAHRNGIVHRDIKPANMLLRKSGHLLLTDFGLAKILEDTMNITRTGVRLGTPHYKSPEQGTGRPVDARTDIYSLGIVLFHCLAGEPPFHADNPLSMSVKHLQDRLPVEKLTANNYVPDRIVQVVLKMTAKQPGERYQSAAELIDALKKGFECPICGADFRPGDPFCVTCGNRLTNNAARLQQQHLGDTRPATDDWSDVPTIVNEERSPAQDLPAVVFNLDAVEEPGASPAQRSLEDINYIGQAISIYHIESEIGRGGFGRVYLARHLDGVYRVAIKIFYAHLSKRQKRNLSLQETLMRDSLKHPYILPVLEVSLKQQPQYIISEYAAGGTLHDRILAWQPRLLPFQEAITILSQVGEALASIHQQGIVHRDLKPANILFNEQGEARLADFDLAVVLDAGDDMKRVDRTGSPPYMAPEQFEGIVSRYSDQYALGCTAYELCTGSRPFSTDNFTAMQFKHAQEQVLAPRLLNPDLPAHVEHAILKALSKRPAERYPDVMAFVEELRGY